MLNWLDELLGLLGLLEVLGLKLGSLALLIVVHQVTRVAWVVHVWSRWAPRHVGIWARLALRFLDEKGLLA